MTNLLLHGIDVPNNVRHTNTLGRPLRDWSPKDRVDVVVTNPPFGGMEEDGIEANFPADFRTRETADLFLVLIMKLLKPGGRAGLVLPDGTLFGEGVKTRIKEALLTECNLHTIVRLPNGVFNPYTGIRTNLLFFTKDQPTTEVWLPGLVTTGGAGSALAFTFRFHASTSWALDAPPVAAEKPNQAGPFTSAARSTLVAVITAEVGRVVTMPCAR